MWHFNWNIFVPNIVNTVLTKCKHCLKLRYVYLILAFKVKDFFLGAYVENMHAVSTNAHPLLFLVISCFKIIQHIGWKFSGQMNRNENCNWGKYTANIYSKIEDKLRYLSAISKQTHLFLDIFESCCNHTQMSVKI